MRQDSINCDPQLTTRAEVFLLATAVLLGAGLRGYRLFEIGLSHFDEGVYATSAIFLWPWTEGYVDYQGFFSPPLFPMLTGSIYCLFGGPFDSGVMLVSWFFSVATIPLAWWLGRTWWNGPAGLLAAYLLAVDGMQVAFARVGLTDATFTFFFWLSVCLTIWGLRCRSWWPSILAGLAVGLAWNTKYNGWLPLLVSVGYLPGTTWKHAIRRYLVIAAIALLCYVPWAALFHVKHAGGYGALLDHHSGYVRGVALLLGNWSQGIDGWLLLVTPTTGAVVLGLALTLDSGCPRLPIVATLIAAVFLAGWLIVPMCLLLVGIGLASASGPQRWRLAWLLIVLVLLPGIYSPYLRLWLPTEVLLLVFLAAGITTAGNCRIWPEPRRTLLVPAQLVPLTALLIAVLHADHRNTVLPEATKGYREAVTLLTRWCAENGKLTASLTRPPLLFYASLQAVPLYERRFRGDPRELDELQPGDRLVVDHAISDAPQFQRQLQSLQADSELRPLAQFAVEPSLVTMLDDYPPAKLPKSAEPYAVRVYQKTRPSQHGATGNP